MTKWDENIDNHIRRSVENVELPFNEASWGKMSAKLDNEFGVGVFWKTRHSIVAISALLMVGIGLMWYYSGQSMGHTRSSELPSEELSMITECEETIENEECDQQESKANTLIVVSAKDDNLNNGHREGIDNVVNNSKSSEPEAILNTTAEENNGKTIVGVNSLKPNTGLTAHEMVSLSPESEVASLETIPQINSIQTPSSSTEKIERHKEEIGEEILENTDKKIVDKPSNPSSVLIAPVDKELTNEILTVVNDDDEAEMQPEKVKPTKEEKKKQREIEKELRRKLGNRTAVSNNFTLIPTNYGVKLGSHINFTAQNSLGGSTTAFMDGFLFGFYLEYHLPREWRMEFDLNIRNLERFDVSYSSTEQVVGGTINTEVDVTAMESLELQLLLKRSISFKSTLEIGAAFGKINTAHSFSRSGAGAISNPGTPNLGIIEYDFGPLLGYEYGLSNRIKLNARYFLGLKDLADSELYGIGFDRQSNLQLAIKFQFNRPKTIQKQTD